MAMPKTELRPLTERQREILRFVAVFICEKEFPPTLREIGDDFGITVKGVYDHLLSLHRKKVIIGWRTNGKLRGASRSLTLPDLGKALIWDEFGLDEIWFRYGMNECEALEEKRLEFIYPILRIKVKQIRGGPR